MPFTITFSDAFEGWPSYYSYYPDWMLGMNNYFYTWKGGDLYQHNDSASNRNTFYLQWWTKAGFPSSAFSPSTMTSVFNPSTLENVLFKAIDLQGDASWDIQLSTDLQNSGFIQSSWFEKKESTYFAFIRNNSSGELSLRSMTGVGVSSTAILTPPTAAVVFKTPPVYIDSIISVGDLVYWVDTTLPVLTPVLAGQLTSIQRPSTQTNLLLNTAIAGAVPIPSNTCYFLYIKNSIAESHGVLGHYCTFTMQNSSTSKVELFTVEADVMKSYP
jgi:hypothetical protein